MNSPFKKRAKQSIIYLSKVYKQIEQIKEKKEMKLSFNAEMRYLMNYGDISNFESLNGYTSNLPFKKMFDQRVFQITPEINDRHHIL
jgi:hypothetical protein